MTTTANTRTRKSYAYGEKLPPPTPRQPASLPFTDAPSYLATYDMVPGRLYYVEVTAPENAADLPWRWFHDLFKLRPEDKTETLLIRYVERINDSYRVIVYRQRHQRDEVTNLFHPSRMRVLDRAVVKNGKLVPQHG